MAKTITITKDKKIFADKIRMIAQSIYDAADDIVGTTEGCTEIEVSFTIETETESGPELPQYEIVRRHYPERQLIDDFIRMRGANALVIHVKEVPDANKDSN